MQMEYAAGFALRHHGHTDRRGGCGRAGVRTEELMASRRDDVRLAASQRPAILGRETGYAACGTAPAHHGMRTAAGAVGEIERARKAGEELSHVAGDQAI